MKRLFPIFALTILAAFLSSTAVADPNFQGFETDTGDWVFNNPSSHRVASGEGVLSVASASGSYHCELFNVHNAYMTGYGSAGFSYLGGKDPVYQGSFCQAVDVYIDPAWSGLGFWIDMSPADVDNNSFYAAEGNFRLTANASSVAVQAINGSILTTITSAGWYSFEICWSKGENPTDLVNMELKVYDSNGTLLGSESFLAIFPQGVYPGESQYLGNNGYVWFTVWQNDFADDVIAIDNVRTFLKNPYNTLGECISNLIHDECSGLRGKDRATCVHDQQDYCFDLFGKGRLEQ